MKHQRISASSHRIKLFFISAFVTIFLAMTITACGFQTKTISGSVWIANEEGNSLTVIDAATFSVVKTVETGSGAHGIVIEPSSRFAYITNIFGNNVAILDLAKLEIMATVPAGIKPNGISFSSLTPTTASSANIVIKLPDTKDSVNEEMKH